VYAFFSSPHQRLSFSRKRFTSYFYKNGKLGYKFHSDPQPVFKFFYIFFIIREVYLIFLRSSFLEKIMKLRRKHNYDKIYSTIVRKRFKKNTPYLIAGDHFTSFYPRNLGFFYSKALDPDTSVDFEDYKNRLLTYLNSLAFALNFYKNIDLTTTITPLFGKFFTRANIFSKPSDTLCSLLLAFDYLINPHDSNFKSKNVEYKKIQNQAKNLAKNLLKEHQQTLKNKILAHLEYLNSRLGLVDPKYSLSGIRDGVFRQSSFYENVVTWKTITLALKYSLITEQELKNYARPEVYKKKIISLFIKNKLIHNDLSQETILENNFSADYLVAYSLNFFDLKNTKDLQILKDQADFVLSTPSLISPIGIYYSNKQPERLAIPVRLFAPKYMSRTIWSHWSTEFICLLQDLTISTGEHKYVSTALKITDSLLQKILFYKGYPELYGDNLKIYQTPFYTSMIDTGWIVNYEFCRQKLKKS
jgi:hypothetical protein